MALGSLSPSTRSKFGPSLQLTGEKSKAGNAPRNDFATSGGPGPSRTLTQEDQDKVDEEKQRESIGALVQTWSDRLQLISVITTFFVAIEATLVGIIIPSLSDLSSLSATSQLANISLMSALVVHAHASIISFFGTFLLIRCKLAVAQKVEEEAEKRLVDSPTSIASNGIFKAGGRRTSPYADNLQTDPIYGRVRLNSLFSGGRIIWSTNPHLVQVGPFNRGQPPTQLLARCHSLCVLLFFIGFLLALMGVMSFAWNRLPLSVSIFSSIWMGFCLVAGFLILVAPSTKNSQIYHYHHNRH